MSFENTQIIDPYLRKSTIGETKLYISTDEEVEQLETTLNLKLPFGYKDYVTNLGYGEYCSYIRVDMPFQITEGYKEYQKFLNDYFFWEQSENVITKKRAIESIKVADTNEGDVIIFHPNNPNELFVLPRHDDLAYEIGSNFYEAIDWLCQLGGETEKRFFVPFNPLSRTNGIIAIENEDWDNKPNISKQFFETS